MPSIDALLYRYVSEKKGVIQLGTPAAKPQDFAVERLTLDRGAVTLLPATNTIRVAFIANVAVPVLLFVPVCFYC
jgi:hypothetical protein